ncbi:hypothetical protein D9M71_818370 [compost metagenome]
MMLSASPGVLVRLVIDRSARASVARLPAPVQSLVVFGSRLMPPPVVGSAEPPLPPVHAVLVSVPCRRASVYRVNAAELPLTATG